MSDFFELITVSDAIQMIGILVSLATGIIAIIFSLITIRQNSRMIKDATRPYVVVYNDFVTGAGTPIQFLIIRNFGHTAATINSFNITPKVDVTYSDELFAHMENQVIAPGQSYSTAFKLQDYSVVLTASITYTSGKDTFSDTYSISQKAISDNVHSKIAPNDVVHSMEIISGCFQDYLRSRL